MIKGMKRRISMGWAVLTSTEEHAETLCVLAVQFNKALIRTEAGGVFTATYESGRTVRIEYKLIKLEDSEA